ncbi:MAG: 2Fe-2S iron-sulfur cluster-binding protein [Aggregatilineales bacterium]
MAQALAGAGPEVEAIESFFGSGQGQTLLRLEIEARRALLEAGISPHGKLSRRANCGGRGLCATCGVWIESDQPPPQHWHDKIGAAFGYPRLACQISVRAPLSVRLVPNKIMWGKPERARRYRPKPSE